MSDYLDRPIYDDIADEARADWRAERPEPDAPDSAETGCDERPCARRDRCHCRRGSRL